MNATYTLCLCFYRVLGIFVGVQTKVIILGNTSAAESRGRTTGGQPQGQAFFRCFELTFTDD